MIDKFSIQLLSSSKCDLDLTPQFANCSVAMLPPDVRIIRNVLRGPQTDLPHHAVTLVFSWHPADYRSNASLGRREFHFAACKHFACNDLAFLLHMLFPGFAFTMSVLNPDNGRVSRCAGPNEALVSLEGPLYIRYKTQDPSSRGQRLDEVMHFSGCSASINHEELLPPVPDALSHDGSAPLSSVCAAGQPLVEVVSHDHEELLPSVPDASSKDLHGSAPLSSVCTAGQPLVEVVSHDHGELLPPVPDALSKDLHGSAPSSSVSAAGQPLVEVASHDHEELFLQVPGALSHDLQGSAPSSSACTAGQPLVEVASHDYEKLRSVLTLFGTFRNAFLRLSAAGHPLVEVA